jgi:hypothetical protein
LEEKKKKEKSSSLTQSLALSLQSKNDKKKNTKEFIN